MLPFFVRYSLHYLHAIFVVVVLSAFFCNDHIFISSMCYIEIGQINVDDDNDDDDHDDDDDDDMWRSQSKIQYHYSTKSSPT